MEDLFQGKSIKDDFEAQVTASLMIQSNALISIKLAVTLCGISRQEITLRSFGRGYSGRTVFLRPVSWPMVKNCSGVLVVTRKPKSQTT